MNPDLASKLKQYVRPDQPFGPPDAADIKEPECAAAVFDWNNVAFAELLTGTDVLVGRRGSGKSALLSTFKGKRYLNREFGSEEARTYRDRHHLSAKTLNAAPDLVVEADTPMHVDVLEQFCHKRNAIPPVEMMARMWSTRIWVIIAQTIKRVDSPLWSSFSKEVQNYVQNEDIVQQALSGSVETARLSPDEFPQAMAAALLRSGRRCVVTFDNLERYKFDDTQNAVLGGLIAATGKLIGVQHPSIDVKLCLPAEVFDHLKTVIFRADKDLQRIQYLHWNTSDLMHLAAIRLKVFLQLHDEDTYDLVKNLRLNDRETLRTFWLRFLPEQVVNAVGIPEDTFTYLLRHTQLLPRQLLTTLNGIARRASQKGRELFRSSFDAQDVVRGIEDMEDSNTQAIIGMYEPVYPLVRELFDLVMPRLKRVFEYGFLHQVYNSSAKQSMEMMQKGDFRQFWRLMLSTGSIGVVEANASSQIYVTGRFEFNSKYTLKISEKDQLCVHPMFSRIYNVEKGRDVKLVLPRGSDFGMNAACETA